VGTTKGDAAKETLFFSADWSELFLLGEAFNETARRAARFNEVLRWICHAAGGFGYALGFQYPVQIYGAGVFAIGAATGAESSGTTSLKCA
jgi:hypothetical protein